MTVDLDLWPLELKLLSARSLCYCRTQFHLKLFCVCVSSRSRIGRRTQQDVPRHPVGHLTGLWRVRTATLRAAMTWRMINCRRLYTQLTRCCRCPVFCTVYRVGQLKWGQLTSLMVTFECIGKIQWFLAHVTHTTRSGVMQILSKFYHNKHLTQFCPLALFYPSQCTNALLFNSATFIKKQVVIHKKILL